VSFFFLFFVAKPCWARVRGGLSAGSTARGNLEKIVEEERRLL
jgi:hypothetical protein